MNDALYQCPTCGEDLTAQVDQAVKEQQAAPKGSLPSDQPAEIQVSCSKGHELRVSLA